MYLGVGRGSAARKVGYRAPAIDDFIFSHALQITEEELLHGASCAAFAVNDAREAALHGDERPLDLRGGLGINRSVASAGGAAQVVGGQGGLAIGARVPTLEEYNETTALNFINNPMFKNRIFSSL